MKTITTQNSKRRIHNISKRAIIIASTSLVIATIFALTFVGSNDLMVHAESDTKNVSGITKTVMIVGHNDSQFLPQIVNINVGDSVRFINQDGQLGGFPHAVISVDGASQIPDNKFGSELLVVGDTFTVKLTESGTYHYIDSIFPEMRGTIVVT